MPEGTSVAYTYDDAGRVLSVSSGLTATLDPATDIYDTNTSYTRDERGWITQVDDVATGIFYIERDDNGLPVRIDYPNDISVCTSYDEQRRATRKSVVRNLDVDCDVVETTSGDILADWDAVRDDSGRITGLDETGSLFTPDMTHQYTYDLAGRLDTAELNVGGSQSNYADYQPDAFGNLDFIDDEFGTLLEDFAYNDYDQLLYDGTHGFTYDNSNRRSSGINKLSTNSGHGQALIVGAPTAVNEDGEQVGRIDLYRFDGFVFQTDK